MEEKEKGFFRPLLDIVTMIVLVVMTILIFGTVVLRYIFSIGFRWTDELISIFFIYLVFLGISIAYRYEDHITVSILFDAFSPKIQKNLKVLIYIISALVIVIFSAYALPIVFGKVGRTLTGGLQIPRAYIYVAFPISAVFIVLEIVGKLKQLLRKTKNI